MNFITQVTQAMMQHEHGNSHRINHFLRVNAYAKIIANLEQVDAKTMLTLETVTLMHDIGIKISLQKYNSGAWNYQQQEGPAEARAILQKLECPDELRERVEWLIAHHHETENVEEIDYQILLEADYLVNAIDRKTPAEEVLKGAEKFFKTPAGWSILKHLLGVD